MNRLTNCITHNKRNTLATAIQALLMGTMLHTVQAAPLGSLDIDVVSAEIHQFTPALQFGVGDNTVQYQQAVILTIDVPRQQMLALPPAAAPFLYIGEDEYRIVNARYSDQKGKLRLTFHVRDWEQLEENAPIVLTVLHGVPVSDPDKLVDETTPRFHQDMVVDKRDGDKEEGKYVASGTLTDNQNQPVAGVTLKVGDQTVTTDANGSWEIADLADGDYTVTASKDGYTIEAQNVTVKDGNVTVDLVATLNTYTASGKVFAETKPVLMPLAGATVHISDKTAVTDSNGYWKIEGLPNGNYTATVTKNGYTIPSQLMKINGEDLTFDFGVVYVAQGVIKNEQKQPVAGVTITIGGKQTQTDAVGYWKIEGLPAGESTLIASKDGYKFAPAKFVLGDQEPNIEVPVTPASTLVMTAKPSPWQAIRQGANVTYTYSLFNGGTQKATGVTFTETVPKGAKLVSLTAKDGGQCDAQTVTCTLPDLTAGATAQVELVLQATDGNSLKNTATATANEYPADVQTSYKTVKPHLSVTVTDNHDPVEMLTDLHYTATVELSPLAPQDTAKDINLVMQLPKGLALKTITAAAGTCDSSQFPLVTCQLPNLSIATPTIPLLDKEGLGVVSQTQVDIDVTLKDAGLLVLNNEAKVTASNYPAHTVREMTNIFIPDNIKIDMVLVIDTTNSMQKEINGLKAALTKLIKEVPAGQRPTMALIEFKDDVRVKAFTQDTDVMLGAVANLVAAGGGTCAEASAEALAVGLKHLKDGGTILLATDASPYPEANLEKLAALIKNQNMKFNALITGDCTSEGDWNEMTK